MDQNLPPDGKLGDMAVRKLEASRPCKLTNTQILSEFSLGISHQSFVYRQSSRAKVGYELAVRLSRTDSHFRAQNEP